VIEIDLKNPLTIARNELVFLCKLFRKCTILAAMSTPATVIFHNNFDWGSTVNATIAATIYGSDEINKSECSIRANVQFKKLWFSLLQYNNIVQNMR
jgi:hypothetical protein